LLQRDVQKTKLPILMPWNSERDGFESEPIV